jgi:hypothetical protein
LSKYNQLQRRDLKVVFLRGLLKPPRFYFEIRLSHTFKVQSSCQVPVAQAYNPSYSGAEIRRFEAISGKYSRDSISKKSNTKTGL